MFGMFMGGADANGPTMMEKMMKKAMMPLIKKKGADIMNMLFLLQKNYLRSIPLEPGEARIVGMVLEKEGAIFFVIVALDESFNIKRQVHVLSEAQLIELLDFENFDLDKLAEKFGNALELNDGDIALVEQLVENFDISDDGK